MKSCMQLYLTAFYPCNQIGNMNFRRFLSSAKISLKKDKLSVNEHIKPVKTFINRNLRNLERYSLANKDVGWSRLGHPDAMNYPPRYFYHRLCLETTSRHTHAYIEHYYGNRVLEVSTKDWSIRKHLYQTTDVTACAVLGSILVEMCIRAGISCAEWLPATKDDSEATKAFLDAFTSAGFSLEEPNEVLFHKTFSYRYGKRGPTVETIE